MSKVTRLLLGALAGWILVGCGAGEPVGAVCDLLPGDVVISELMANPFALNEQGLPSNSSDANYEWFELYNPSSEPKLLDRMVLRRISFDNGVPKLGDEHFVRAAGSIAPRSYMVFGDGDREFVDYVYDDAEAPTGLGETFGMLGNSAGGISLACRERTIDEVWWGVPGGAQPPDGEGEGLSFDGGLAPDALLNDDEAYWCSGGEAYDALGNVGTPGEPNIVCGLVACEENGARRDIVAPLPGDLVVSEILVDPSGVDGQQYWIELFVAAAGPVDLNRLRLVASAPGMSAAAAVVEGRSCISAAPGDYVVIAMSDDPTLNGGITPDALAPDLDLGATFFAGGGMIEISRAGELIDAAAVPAGAEAGRSWSLDGAALLAPLPAGLNDRGVAFCPADASATGFFAGTGTPGAPNAPCGTIVCTEGGIQRDVLPPEAGDLVLSEIFADPSGTDRNKEWLEIYVARGPIDLNGSVVTQSTLSGSRSSGQVRSESCATGATGDFMVVAFYHEADAAGSPDNGGITPDAIVVSSKDSFLFGTEGAIDITRDGTLLDSAASPAALAGHSQALRPELLSVAGNDSVGAFCAGTTTGLFAESGTPKRANICDNSCFEGSTPRTPRSPASGELVITELYGNQLGTDVDAEWLEVFSSASGTIDLNGLTITSQASSTPRVWGITTADCIPVAAGSYAIIGFAGAVNDGVVLDALLENTDLFHNTAATISIYAGATLIDQTPPLDCTDGVSRALDRDLLDAAANDAAACWGNSSAASGGFANRGSPGLPNPDDVCP